MGSNIESRLLKGENHDHRLRMRYLGGFCLPPSCETIAPIRSLKLMDEKRDRSGRTSFSTQKCDPHYRNTLSGERRAGRGSLASHRDRLIPFAVINPFYAGWRDDLKACHETRGDEGGPPPSRVQAASSLATTRACHDPDLRRTERNLDRARSRCASRIRRDRRSSAGRNIPSTGLGRRHRSLVKAFPRAGSFAQWPGVHEAHPLGLTRRGLARRTT